MCSKELTGGVCAIDLEALVWTREFPDETEIVKCSRDVEKFKIAAKFLLAACSAGEDRVRKRESSRRLWPSGVRIIAISTCRSASPRTSHRYLEVPLLRL
jgi:hypothetical protein